MPQNKQKRDEVGTTNQLLGWPGYRTRPGRSGLDPLDTRNEAAHMEGTFLRNVFTFRARTRNPFYLFLMFVFGVIPFAIFVVLMTGGMPSPDSFSLVPLIYFLVFVLVTGTVTINFSLSILEIFGIIPSRKQVGNSGHKGDMKKLSKQRRDSH